jgi:DNA invertase Pin-like site-specific DNA recombinase
MTNPQSDTRGLRIGYTRVSTVDQAADRQLDGIQLDKLFADQASGKDAQRPQLQLLLEFARQGDLVIVHSMDRLARNLDDLRSLVARLNARGVRVQFVKEGLTFTGDDSPMAKLLLSMMGAVAEFERELIRERQAEGIALAKAKGVYKGRKPALDEAGIKRLKEMVGSGVSKALVARRLKISRDTLYRYLEQPAEPAGT